MDPDHSGLDLLLIFFIKNKTKPQHTMSHKGLRHMCQIRIKYSTKLQFLKDKVVLFLTSCRIGHLVLQV